MITICSLWGTEGVKWAEANWTWGECQMVQEICHIWSTTKFLWAGANWKWSESECSSSVPPIPPIPVVVIGNQPGVDAETLIQPWQLEEPWNPYKTEEKRKKLIRLICKVNGKEYSEEKEIKDFPITVGDIRTVVKTVANINLDFKLEE